MAAEERGPDAHGALADYIRSSPLALALVEDDDLHVRVASPSFARLLGSSPSRCVGLTLPDHLRNGDRVAEELSPLIERGEPVSGLRLQPRDSEETAFVVTAWCAGDDAGPLAVLAVPTGEGNELPARMPHPEDLDLFQVTTVVRIPDEVRFSFGRAADDIQLQLDTGLDKLNFTELPPGTRMAQTRSDALGIRAFDTDGMDRTDDWFSVADGELVTRRAAMPAMLTTDPDAIRQDCLCYMMERVRLQHPAAGGREHPELPESAP